MRREADVNFNPGEERADERHHCARVYSPRAIGRIFQPATGIFILTTPTSNLIFAASHCARANLLTVRETFFTISSSTQASRVLINA